MNKKAVSEVLSYMLIFGVVLTTLGIVYTQVYALTVETAQKFKIEGIKESFRKIYNVFVLSVYGGASVQQIQIELQGGHLFTENTTIVKIKMEDEILEFYPKSLNYQLGNYRATLESGALWEDYSGQQKTLQNPSIYIKMIQVPQASGFERVLVIVLNNFENDVSIAGEGTIVIVFNSSLQYSKIYSGGKNLDFEIITPYPDLWDQYLSQFGTVERNNSTLKMSTTAGSIVLTVYRTNFLIKQV